MANIPEYWRRRILADEERAQQIAAHASEEMAKMYRQQYLRVVKEIDKLKAQIDYGKPLTRSQLWNYARWRKVEESLHGFVAEATHIDTQLIHDALDAEFERVIGEPSEMFGGNLGGENIMRLTEVQKKRIISGSWSGEDYSARVWRNTSAIADKMRTEITNMLVDGKSTQDIRREIMRQFNVCYNNADRLVRTEVSYVHNQAALERYRANGNEQLQIISAKDESVCDVCKEFPGKPYPVDNPPFLPAHPRCRCCYAPWDYLSRKAYEQKQEAKRAQEQTGEENTSKPATISLPDIQIYRSLGAKAVNYDIIDFREEKWYNIVEGTRLQDVEVFCGKGTSSVFRDAAKFARKYGGKVSDWQHAKATAWIIPKEVDEGSEIRHAEVHWAQCEEIGKVDFFVKRWLDEG